MTSHRTQILQVVDALFVTLKNVMVRPYLERDHIVESQTLDKSNWL